MYGDPQPSFNSNQQTQNENEKDEQKSTENHEHEINGDQNFVDQHEKSETSSIIKHDVNDSEIFNAMANVTAASVRHMFWAGFCVSITLNVYHTE